MPDASTSTEKNSSNGLIIFLVAVMLIVLGAVIYIWVDVSNAQRQQQQLDDLSSQIEQTKTKNDTSAQEAENQPPTESESNDGNSSPADLENPTDTTITEPN